MSTQPARQGSVEQSQEVRLCAAIAFHFAAHRLPHLGTVLQNLAQLRLRSLQIVVYTNLQDADGLARLREFCAARSAFCTIRPVVPKHPFLLTWAHKSLIEEVFDTDAATHFLSLEDDTLFTQPNLDYFLSWRDALDKYRLIPSFIRTERTRYLRRLVSTDNQHPVRIGVAPQVVVGGSLFIQPYNPHCAVFILDRRLAEAYRASDAFDEERSRALTVYGVMERAAMALCFVDPPPGFTSRYVVRLDGSQPDQAALIPHISNTYARNRQTAFATLDISRMFAP